MNPDLMITRSVPLLDYEISRSGDGRTVIAYAATFGNMYEVDDQHGHYDEKINPRAFNKELARAGALSRVQVYFNHGRTLWGTPSERFAMPIAVPEEIKADGRGLLTRSRYLHNDLAEQTLEMWREGAIRGQSFRGPIYPNGQKVIQRGPNGRPVVERLQLGLTEYGPAPSVINEEAGLVAIRSSSQLLAEFGEMTPEERLEFAALLSTSATGDPHVDPETDPETDPDDPSPVVPPVVPPAAGLSDELLELANANRRRRLPS